MNTNFFQGTKIMRFFVPNKFFGKKNALSSENNCFWQILGKKIMQNLSAYAPLRPLISSKKMQNLLLSCSWRRRILTSVLRQAFAT